MKASILAIGSELTTGQIINKNATTLSRKLKDLGVVITTHLTVPDDKQIILNSLKFLESQLNENGDLLFVTGGLGPTSDDFTRDVLAEWAGAEMIFDPSSWERITQRLTSRGYKVHEMQKQQCYFPKNAKILFNSEGTANAFKFSIDKKTVYVLPGPPREIEAIWKEHILADLTEKTKNLDKQIIRSWDTIGVPEAEVAYAVEEALKDRPAHHGLVIGYRVHQPYVEVKLSFSPANIALWAPWIKKVDDVLKNITVTKDFSDVTLLCYEKIKSLDFTFYDFISEGYLHERLAKQLKIMKNWSFKQSSVAPSVDLFAHEDDFLALFPYEEDKCIVIQSLRGNRVLKTIEAPMKAPLMNERRRQYFAEMALIELSRTNSP